MHDAKLWEREAAEGAGPSTGVSTGGAGVSTGGQIVCSKPLLFHTTPRMSAARRIPLVDEEAQIVLAFGVFIRKPGSSTPRNVASWWS